MSFTNSFLKKTVSSHFGTFLYIRKKNKRILRLRDECARYERLLAEDRRLPSQEELERRIEKVEERLAERDKKIEVRPP